MGSCRSMVYNNNRSAKSDKNKVMLDQLACTTHWRFAAFVKFFSLLDGCKEIGVSKQIF